MSEHHKDNHKPLEVRFHRRYKVDEVTGCWNWVGATTGKRTGHYGKIREGKQVLLAHRISYEIHKGDPAGKCVLHKCDNRRCVNPEHLFLGTRRDNTVDRESKARGPQGSRNWCAKLTEEDIPVIRELAKSLSEKEIALRFGVSQGAIYQAIRKQTWAHVL